MWQDEARSACHHTDERSLVGDGWRNPNVRSINDSYFLLTIHDVACTVESTELHFAFVSLSRKFNHALGLHINKVPLLTY